MTLTETNSDKVFSEYAESAYFNITWVEKHQIYVCTYAKNLG